MGGRKEKEAKSGRREGLAASLFRVFLLLSISTSSLSPVVFPSRLLTCEEYWGAKAL